MVKQKTKSMGTRSNKQLLIWHLTLHKWWNNSKLTPWTKTKIFDEHSKVVKVMKKRGIKHNSPLR